MPQLPILVSIQIGQPRQLGQEGAADPADRPWTTAYLKEVVNGPAWLSRAGLVGDCPADLRHHGGPDQAVLAYAAAHYDLWRAELGRPDLPYGAFAENFTIAGLDEDDVCIGDVYAVGDAIVQVTQPRQPCGKIARALGIAGLTERTEATGRTGWYLRVLQEGEVAAGMAAMRRERPYPQWTITRATAALRQAGVDAAAARELAACPLLGIRWRQALEKKINREARV